VVTEAIYVGLRIRPVLRDQVHVAPLSEETLSLSAFLRFYIPLALTSLIWLAVQPIGSAALGRMPDALASLAVWPVISGLLFIMRSPGVAYNEVVIALLDEPGAARNLRRFAIWMAAGTTLLMLLLVTTPLSYFWFAQISALPPRLAHMARRGLWLAILLPALSMLLNWYQGTVVNSQHTRSVTEAVVLYLLVTIVIQGSGILWGRIPGLYVALAAFALATLAQTLWLWYRSRPVLHRIYVHDANVCTD
jgi:hypothetical protein